MPWHKSVTGKSVPWHKSMVFLFINQDANPFILKGLRNVKIDMKNKMNMKIVINLLKLNNEFGIGFHLPGIEEELRVVAIQRSIKNDTDNACIGTEFVKMDSSIQAKLCSFLSIDKA